MQIDVRIEVDGYRTVNKDRVESVIIHDIVADVNGVKSAVILRNNGFAHLMPDEDTRQER